MRSSTSALVVAGSTLVVAGIVGIGLMLPAPEEGRVGPGAAAPEFSALTIDPPVKTRTLLDYRGDVLLLNVWATWCPPCVEEMPTMQRVHELYADRGLRVVAVSVDDSGAQDLIRQFREEHGLSFEILHDPDYAVFDAYKLNGVPMTFLIDAGGIIRVTRYAADWSSDENRAEIERLIDR